MKASRAAAHAAELTRGMKFERIARDQHHSPYLDGEPLFIIRGRDNFALAVLRLLKSVYDITDDELAEWAEWRAENERNMRDPGTTRGQHE